MISWIVITILMAGIIFIGFDFLGKRIEELVRYAEAIEEKNKMELESFKRKIEELEKIIWARESS